MPARRAARTLPDVFESTRRVAAIDGQEIVDAADTPAAEQAMVKIEILGEPTVFPIENAGDGIAPHYDG